MSSAQAVLAGLMCKTSCWWRTASPYVFITLAVLGALSIGTTLAPWLLAFVRYRQQDLKKKYGAQWALVTGGSSGIGLSMCKQLAAQGLNLVVVAVGDDLLTKAVAELRKAFPSLEIRSVGVNLSAADHKAYLEPIVKATEDITIQIVCNNAGYMVTGFFADTPLEKWLANLNCNQTASIAIAHHFVARMRAAKLKGAVLFTSSPANIMPSPFSTLYGATKAAVTHFACSLACEVGPDGIDVSVLHPSPVATRFYTGAHALPTLQMFKNTAVGPDAVADVALRGVGRSVIIDQGYYPISFRLLLRIIDFTALVEIMGVSAAGVKDYQVLKQQTEAAKVAATAASTAAAAAPAPAKADASKDADLRKRGRASSNARA